jgi:hypothetical protein
MITVTNAYPIGMNRLQQIPSFCNWIPFGMPVLIPAIASLGDE